MQGTLKELIELSNTQGYHQLAALLEKASDTLTLKRIKTAATSEKNFVDSEVLYVHCKTILCRIEKIKKVIIALTKKC